jgi:hypothetical protein
VLIAAIAPVLRHLDEPLPTQFIYVSVPADPLPGFANFGTPVANVYPYSRDGRLLQDVLLYDGAGQPLDIGRNGVADPNRRFLHTSAGQPLFNSFPIRYFEPGTTRVKRPKAGPQVNVPAITTPPLTARARRPRSTRGGR